MFLICEVLAGYCSADESSLLVGRPRSGLAESGSIAKPKSASDTQRLSRCE